MATPKKKLLKVEPREETGKNAMRRLRKSGLTPGIVFGRSGETTPVKFQARELEKLLHSRTGFNTLFTIEVDGSKDEAPMVIVKDYQVEPVSHEFLHVSFYRVHMDRLMEVEIPIHTTGTAPGVKDQGGILELVLRELTVECLPADIPESFTIDISWMHIGDAVRVSDLGDEFGDKIKALVEEEQTIVQLIPPRKLALPEPGEEVEGEEGEEVEGEEGEGEEGEESSEEESAE